MKSFYDIVRESFAKRERLFGNDACDVFRLVNGEGDGAGALYADLYGTYLLVQIYDRETDRAVEENRDSLIRAAQTLPVEVKGILVKRRDEKASAQTSYDSELMYGELPPDDLVVTQNGMKMFVDLVHGLNTGLFLDMRQIREKLREVYPEAQSVLNLFSYTCAFALHARMNGVRNALNVDVSKTVLRRGMKNYELNGFNADNRDFIQEDCGRWLRRASKKDKKWDLTVFDPPTFSRGKNGSFSVKSDYAGCLADIGKITGKYCLSVINTHTVTAEEYRSFHPDSWKNVWLSRESDDFPFSGTPYLKAGLWLVR
jgi:23S rRNA (cytosine1962-C5)-methyltransferase